MRRVALALLLALCLTDCTSMEPDSGGAPEVRRSALDVQPAGLAPLRFDLEGTWVLEPGVLVTDVDFDGSVCERDWAKENRLAVGRDTLVLERGEVYLQDEFIIVPYTGTYTHYEGYGAFKDNLAGATYGCVLEMVTYEMEAELHIVKNGGYAYFAAEGTVTNSPVYNHGRTVGMSAASFGDATNGTRQMFEGASPDVALLSVGFGNFAGDTSIPDGCDFELEDYFPSERIVTAACVGRGSRAWRFEKVDGLPDINPKGEITGELEELLPDASPTGRPIEHAVVEVFRQPRHVRSQLGGESDEAYQNYLDAQERARVKVGEAIVEPNDMGMFTVDGLSALTQNTSRSTMYQASEHTVVVTKARSEETTPDAANENVLFEQQTVYNVPVGEMLDVGLRPFDALGQKIEIAERLQFKAPKGWRPIETTVLNYLYDLESGAAPSTPEANEAVRRALWAEYAARDGFAHADILLDFMLDGFAALVTDLLIPDIDFNPRNIVKAQKRIRNYSKDAAQAQSTLDILRSAKIEEFHQRMAAAPTAGMQKALKGKPAVANRIKAVAKAVVFAPSKQLAANYAGANAGLVGEIIDAVQLAFDAIVDVTITGNLGGVVKSLVKKRVAATVKAAKAPLLDNDGIVPISFTQLADEGLQTTLNNVSTWANDDGAAYRADRGLAIAELNEMNQRATDLIAAQELVKATGAAAGTIEDVTGAVSVIPIVAYAEKLAKMVKILSNVAMFVHPLIYVFFELPDAVNNAGASAWGEPIDGANPAVFTGTLVAASPETRRALQLSDGEYRRRLEEILDLLRTHDHEQMIELTWGTDDTPGIEELYTAMSRDRNRLLDELGGLAVYDVALQRQINTRLGRALDADAATAAFVQELTTFLIDAATGVFTSNTDAWYLMRRSQLFRSLDVYDTSLSEIGWAGAALVEDDGAVLAQLVRAEDVEIVDEAGATELDPSSPHTLTVTATIRNLSTVPLDGPVTVRLEASAGTGGVTVAEPVQVLDQTLVAFEDADVGAPGETVQWTVDYTPGEAGDAVLLRIRFEENGLPPTRYNGSGTVAEFAAPVVDDDIDGMPDAWESAHGLPTDMDNGEDDTDGDGVSDGREYTLGLEPSTADTDGDGRSDGDEVYGGTLAVVSDPLEPDTDGDGVDDGADQAPLDDELSETPSDEPEPCIELDTDAIVFTFDEAAAIIGVSNGCEGELRWTAHTEDPRIARTVATSPNGAGEQLVVMLGTPFPDATPLDVSPPPSTTIWVQDTAGRVPDAVPITVSIGTPLEGGGGDMGTDAGEPTNPGDDVGIGSGGPDASTPPPFDGPNDETSGGCCAQADGRADGGFGLFVLFGLWLVSRRRR